MATLSWLRTHGDRLLAVLLTVAVQAQLWLGSGLNADDLTELDGPLGRPITALFAAACTVTLAWRTRYPLLPLGFAIALLISLGGGGIDGLPSVVLTLVTVCWTVGSSTRDTTAIVGTAGVAALILAAIGRDPDAAESLGDLAVPVVVLGGAWAAGLATRLRRDQLADAEARARTAVMDRDASTAAAVVAERARIARDLHDVVAHAIAVIVVQARGTRHALRQDPDAVEPGLRAIESTAADALTEMRRLFEVLDPETPGDDRRPTPGLAELDHLIDQVRGAGLPVDVTVVGEPTRLPAGVDLSAYRIIQEALTNALRHAGPATAAVRIRYDESMLDVEVEDTGRGRDVGDGATGRGLPGMRERAALVGGSVAIRSLAGGGTLVHARLPTSAPAG